MPSSAKDRTYATLLCVLALGMVAALDYLTGDQLGFFVFYFVPVALAAWWLGPLPALVVCVCAATVWYGIDAQFASTTPPPYRYWNAGIRLVSFVSIALAVAEIRASLARERQANAELSEALARIKQLRGLLPICASCKAIRNDSGYWEQLEAYIEKHSDAAFSHGICPACLERLYQQLDEEETRRPRGSVASG